MRVNSLHAQGVDKLAPRARLEATCCEDGQVEALSVPDSDLANNTDTEQLSPPVPTATVSGRAFYDVNRNGVSDAAEPSLVGYIAELLQFRATGTVVVGSAT